MQRLFHVSDQPGIERFDPRPAPNNPTEHGNVVWAVDEEHLPNYLLPRDCPRVCFTLSQATTESDRLAFFQHSQANRVIAIEWEWLERIRNTLLTLYELPTENFLLQDANAGYYVAPISIRPQSATPILNLLEEIKRRNVELRVTPDLWPLHDAVAKSSLEFSMIRMRNAVPR